MTRLSDDFLQCVVFLGYPKVETDDELTPEGTGFLLHIHELAGGYLVTARHVADTLGEHPWAIRMNDDTGRGRLIRMDGVRWHRHPDPSVDLAAIAFERPEWAAAQYVPLHLVMNPAKAEEKDIGPGDMVYILGLFHLLHGTKKNLTYAHPGHIALIEQHEPIPITGVEGRIEFTSGHLVAAQTLRGSSGSPVFVRRTIEIDVPDHNNPSSQVKAWVHGNLWLLGVWQGEWRGPPAGDLGVPMGAGFTVPVGTGIVVPAKRILELLDSADVRAERAERSGMPIAHLPTLT